MTKRYRIRDPRTGAAVYEIAVSLTCECGYDGSDGWDWQAIGETPRGLLITAWFCYKCGKQVCIDGEDCPPDRVKEEKR